MSLVWTFGNKYEKWLNEETEIVRVSVVKAKFQIY